MSVGRIEIEDFYPYSFAPRVRYGNDQPPHEQIDRLLAAGLRAYELTLRDFLPLTDQLLQIPRDLNPGDERLPAWINGFLPGLDSVTLYGLLSTKQPRLYLEIGSGYSTRFAALAARRNSPGTRIVSIDPAPRAEVDALCDEIVRSPLQDCDLKMFDQLERDDILYVDGSHRLLQNSDVEVLFLEVLPRLRKGVLIHLHDICWPYDYPTSYLRCMYSEQYVLGALLVVAPQTIEVVLPNTYISYRTALGAIFDALWNAPHLASIERHGCSFWFRLR